MKPLFHLSLFTLCAVASAQEPERNTGTKVGATTPDMLQAAQFTKPGMTGSSVGITMDDQRRVYVSHTNRRTNAELDIRKNTSWLEESLALTSPEGRQDLIKRKMPDTWKSLSQYKEKIIRLEDTDGDGRADRSKVVFEGLNELGSGLAGGVLWHDGALFVTCMPSLWKLTDKDGDGWFETKQELVRGIGYHIGYGGHDMHGPTLGPDGRIYWTTGDKGIHVITKEGREFHYPGEGGCFRIEPDGSGFEVFARGLRNPQELAFDDFGNLITVDNDGDFGDKERVVHIIEGSDSGWRAQYQYRSDRKWIALAGYNPWLEENLWKPQQPDQPAYLLPPLANFSAGPCGFEYNPGTALSEKWRNTFFIAESSKQISAFRLQPSGATFTMSEPRVAFTGAFITGLFFGSDGALYGADWGENEWMPHMKGGVLKLDDVAAIADSQREEVKKLLTSSYAKMKSHRLMELLDHADQRIRIRAQHELARRGDYDSLSAASTKAATLLGRVHATWGLGQLARKQNPDALESLESLLKSPEPELRAQSARMLSDSATTSRKVPALGDLLGDEEPRARAAAALALHKLGAAPHLDAVLKLLADNNDKDRALAHAGAMALSSVAKDKSTIDSLRQNPSAAVRRAAVVACRISRSSHVQSYLDDADLSIVAEAAKAVHDDLSIPDALPALAAILDNASIKDGPTLRRAISANLRLGTSECLSRLFQFAGRPDAHAAMRVEALDSIAQWPNGLGFDRVQGFHRGLPPRDKGPVAERFAAAFESLITVPDEDIQRATARIVRALNYQPAIEKLTALALDESQSVQMRSTALETLAVARAPRAMEAVDLASKNAQPVLRMASLRARTELQPEATETFAAIDSALASNELAEQQSALSLIGSLKSAAAERILSRWLTQLEKQIAPPALALDIYEAAREHGSKALKKQLGKVDTALRKKQFGSWRLALEGGDVKEGELIFKTSTTGACAQCHSMVAGIPGVGPDLHGVATRRDREQLLRAIIDPQGQIAEGYGLVTATLKSGAVQSGLLVKESPQEITLRLPATPITNVVKKSDIVTRTKPSSAMPVMTSLLTKFEVRDLVAYLATLR